MRKLVISTGNRNKVKEIKEILKDLPIQILTKDEVGLQELEVVEDGTTLEANSLKKARAISSLVDAIVMADDSGLFVDALHGEPGVYSSRYGGEDGNDSLNNKVLLKNLEGKNREATFKSVIAFITEDKREYTVYGECKGKILEIASGNNGFGYDPIFSPDGYEHSFASMPIDIKNSISHRKRALDKFREKLMEIVGEDNENTSCS
ncbi:MAG: RdgB/HAM1 family non-canonical purine NTP pyrophosphatase [Gudongella sp.]|nr:RdgB/HAM1 family non-canonical purine NTP pyrophosphatase [Gudongella sp.]